MNNEKKQSKTDFLILQKVIEAQKEQIEILTKILNYEKQRNAMLQRNLIPLENLAPLNPNLRIVK